MACREDYLNIIEETANRHLSNRLIIPTDDLKMISEIIQSHQEETDSLNDTIESLQAQIEDQQETIDESADLENSMFKAVEIVKELSSWMRSHTGPADGTHEMLVKAIEFIKDEGRRFIDEEELRLLLGS